MAVNPANMEDCFPKARCLSGANEGVAYDRDSPCGGAANVAFNPVTCDCEATEDCVASDECGYDIDWAVEAGANTLWSIKLCGASSCSTNCASDTYRQCATYSPNSGTTYLDPGKCLRQVKLLATGPCPVEAPAPEGAYIRMDWYECNPGETDPGIPTCGTAIAQMPGGGYCSTVITGPGIVETGRVQRVKVITSHTLDWTSRTTASAGCGNCDSTITSSGDNIAIINWRAPVEESVSELRFSSISPSCASVSCPGTWKAEFGVDWVQIGTNTLYDGSTYDVLCGASDGIAIVATAAVSSGGITKGQKIAYVFNYGWSGAVGCIQTGSSLVNSVEPTAYSCYKPSDLV